MEKKEISAPANNAYQDIAKNIKRFFTVVFGMTILIIGILMIVLPGPAIVFVPLGLTILASEYLWARIWLDRIKKKTTEIKDMIFKK